MADNRLLILISRRICMLGHQRNARYLITFQTENTKSLTCFSRFMVDLHKRF